MSTISSTKDQRGLVITVNDGINHFRKLPDVLMGVTASFLNKAELKTFRMVGKKAQEIVENVIPRLPILWATHRENNLSINKQISLDIKAVRVKNKYQLAFMKFMDRPLYQRVGLVFLTIILAPAIFIYHSPRLGKKGLHHVIKPLIRGAFNFLNKTVELVRSAVKKIFVALYEGIVKPLGRLTVRVIKFTLQALIVPACLAIASLAKAIDQIIRKVCTYINENAITPSKNFIKKIWNYTNKNMVQPSIELVKTVARALFITFPRKINAHVIQPSLEALANCAKFIFDNVVVPVLQKAWEGVKITYTRVLTPLMNLIQKVAKAIFITFPSKVWEHILQPILETAWEGVKFTYNNILTPIMRLIRAVARGVFVTLPGKVWQNVAKPVLSTIWEGVKITYNRVLTPLAKIIRIFAKGLFITIPYKVYLNVIKPIGEFVWKVIKFGMDTLIMPMINLIIAIGKEIFITVPKFVYNHVIVPLATAVGIASNLLYGNVIIPLAKTVSAVARIIFVELPVLIKNSVIDPSIRMIGEVKDVMTDTLTSIWRKIFGS